MVFTVNSNNNFEDCVVYNVENNKKNTCKINPDIYYEGYYEDNKHNGLSDETKAAMRIRAGYRHYRDVDNIVEDLSKRFGWTKTKVVCESIVNFNKKFK